MSYEEISRLRYRIDVTESLDLLFNAIKNDVFSIIKGYRDHQFYSIKKNVKFPWKMSSKMAIYLYHSVLINIDGCESLDLSDYSLERSLDKSLNDLLLRRLLNPRSSAIVQELLSVKNFRYINFRINLDDTINFLQNDYADIYIDPLVQGRARYTDMVHTILVADTIYGPMKMFCGDIEITVGDMADTSIRSTVWVVFNDDKEKCKNDYLYYSSFEHNYVCVNFATEDHLRDFMNIDHKRPFYIEQILDLENGEIFEQRLIELVDKFPEKYYIDVRYNKRFPNLMKYIRKAEQHNHGPVFSQLVTSNKKKKYERNRYINFFDPYNTEYLQGYLSDIPLEDLDYLRLSDDVVLKDIDKAKKVLIYIDRLRSAKKYAFADIRIIC